MANLLSTGLGRAGVNTVPLHVIRRRFSNLKSVITVVRPLPQRESVIINISFVALSVIMPTVESIPLSLRSLVANLRLLRLLKDVNALSVRCYYQASEPCGTIWLKSMELNLMKCQWVLSERIQERHNRIFILEFIKLEGEDETGKG